MAEAVGDGDKVDALATDERRHIVLQDDAVRDEQRRGWGSREACKRTMVKHAVPCVLMAFCPLGESGPRHAQMCFVSDMCPVDCVGDGGARRCSCRPWTDLQKRWLSPTYLMAFCPRRLGSLVHREGSSVGTGPHLNLKSHARTNA